MEGNPQLVYDRVHQIPIVQLTRNQENQIIRNFPWIFNLGLPQGERNISGRSEEGPARRNVAGQCELLRRVCQPNPIYEPLVLALQEDGDVVQIVQVKSHSSFYSNKIPIVSIKTIFELFSITGLRFGEKIHNTPGLGLGLGLGLHGRNHHHSIVS